MTNTTDLTPQQEAMLKEKIRAFRAGELAGEEADVVKALLARFDEVRREQATAEREWAQRTAEYEAAERLRQRQHEVNMAQLALEAEQREVERRAAVRNS